MTHLKKWLCRSSSLVRPDEATIVQQQEQMESVSITSTELSVNYSLPLREMLRNEKHSQQITPPTFVNEQSE